MAVNLTKGQKISLEKESGGGLQKVVMGLGWDMAKSGGGGFLSGMLGGGNDSIDLDASCLLFDAQNALKDTVYFGQLKSKDGSIRHSGDNLTGEGDGDDEQITVDLATMPAWVDTLVFTVSSFRGQSFDKVANAYCRLVNPSNGQEIARYQLSAQGPHTAQVMTKLYKHNGEWKMAALGDNCSGRTFKDMLPAITPSL